MGKKLIPRTGDTPTRVSESYFYGLLMGSKNITHIHHAQTQGKNSYATHMALGAFYEGITDIVDSVIETCQGAMNHIINYDKEALTYGLYMNPVDYLVSLRKMICDNRFEIISEEYTNIHSELDNYVTLLDQTIYKLMFLKD